VLTYRGDIKRFQPSGFGSSLAVAGDTLIVGDPTATSVIPVNTQLLGSNVPIAEPVGDVQVFDATTGAQLGVFQDPKLATIDPNNPPNEGAFKNFGLAVASGGDHISITEPVPVEVTFFGGSGFVSGLVAGGKAFSGSVGDASIVDDGPYPGGTSVARHGDEQVLGDPIFGVVKVVRPVTPAGGGTPKQTVESREWAPDSAVTGVRNLGLAGVPSAFGEAVAWVGEQILVGAPGDHAPSGVNSGRVYLLPHLPDQTEVTVLRDGSLRSVHSITTTEGPDAPGGLGPVVLVPDVTFDSPTPESGANFGAAVAARGQDVLIGAPNAGAGNPGAAYLFDDTGRLLLSLASPSGSTDGRFGFSVAALGHDILVGAPDDSTRDSQAGAVYLFDGTTGQLLQTFYSPHPQDGGHFGFALAAFGSDRFFVGAPGDDPSDGGAVYLVRTGRPVTVQAGQVLDGVDFAQTLTPDFAITAPARTVQLGHTTTALLSTTALNGFAGSINLVVAAPPEITVALSQAAVAVGDTSTLTLTADPAATSISSPVLVTVTATSGSIQHQVTIPLTIQPSPPDLFLSATPSTANLDLGVWGSATFTITAEELGGLQGSIALDVPNLPQGLLHSLSPLQADGTSTLTVTVEPRSGLEFASSDPKWWPLTVTATAGLVMHQIPLILRFVDTGNVSQFFDPRGRIVDLVSPEGDGFTGYVHLGDQDPNPLSGFPPGTSAADFPVGFFEFSFGPISPGQHVQVTLVLDLLPGETINQYWMFGPPGLDARGKPLPKQWYEFSPYDPITDTGAEIIGNKIIVHFVDGQRGDDDLTPDGVIDDPGGPAFVTAADLSLGMSAAPAHVAVGRDLTFTLTVTNRSAVAAPGVVVTDPLPAGVAFVSAESSQGACMFNGGSVLCSLGTLAPGASATIRVVVRPMAPGPVTDTARVAGALFDPVASDNLATASALAMPARPRPRFVTALYNEILGRFPEPHGLAYWVGRLKARSSPRRVARAIFDSREHRRLVRQHLDPRIPLRRAFLDAVRAERSHDPSQEQDQGRRAASPVTHERTGGRGGGGPAASAPAR
jgi:uncharacterized repeat protein (TIGR01451 family)